MMFKKRRDYFNEILRKYQDYVELYRFFNHGRLEGKASFREFYWMYCYYNRNMKLTFAQR